MADSIDEQLLTAYALGEQDAAERSRVEALLADDAAAQSQIDEIRATATLLRAELADEVAPQLSAIQHAAIERQLEPHPLRFPTFQRNWALWGSLAASLAIVCTVLANVLPRIYHLGSGHWTYNGTPNSSGSSQLHETGPIPPEGGFIQSEGAGPANAARPIERGEIGFSRVSDAPVAGVPTATTYPDPATARVVADLAGQITARQIPSPQRIRIDELINAIGYHYAAPTGGAPLSANVELAACPWNESHRLLRVGLRTADAGATSQPETTGVSDLRIDVEFNPVLAGAYRLIGYETGDAGDREPIDTHVGGYLPAGRSLTALYEVIPASGVGPDAPAAPLKYQTVTPAAQTSRELATVNIRYRDSRRPDAAAAAVNLPVTDDGRSIAAASDDFRVAAAIAALGLVLRHSPYQGSASFNMAIQMLNKEVSNYMELAPILDLARNASLIVPPVTPEPRP